MKNEKLAINTKEEEIKYKLSNEYSALYMDRFLLIDTRTTRLMIDDISYRATAPSQEDIETLALSCKEWIEIYDAKSLTMALSNKTSGLFGAINKRRTLVIFPGSGAKTVMDCLPEGLINGIKAVPISTQRIINEKTGAVEKIDLAGKTQVREAIREINAETIIVLDDIIVTGSTLTTIRDTFLTRGIEFFAGSLMMLSPLQNRNKLGKSSSGVAGYTSIISPIVYQGTNGIPPLNSLSTLIGNSEKSSVVRRKYMDNYVTEPKSFLAAVKELQTKVISI